MDLRDDLTWIAIELTRFGESKVEDGTLVASLRSDLGVDEEHPFFVPATSYTKGRRTVTVHLMEGYVFTGAGLDDIMYFALEKKPYVQQVMSTHGGPHRMRVLSVIRNSHVQEMRAKLRSMMASDIELNAWVKVTDGQYKQLEGRVLDLDDEHAFVKIEMRSLKVIATIPRVFLDPEGVTEPG